MKIYLVGGAVRDKLLGQPVKEKDFVVVQATVDDMLKLGYRQVGKEFPVFLHPKTNEEYALARMERKVKPGYQGFTFDTSPHVTLEEDLKRRDLTINAMAETPEGKLIDPYHGEDDLKNKLLRHVSDAFAEDPVRILRVGRFLARYDQFGFHVAPETMQLMKKMVENSEVNALVAERVWKELERALGEKNPEQFFQCLAECGALDILFPEIKMNSLGMKALISAEKISPKSSIRFAALLHDLDIKTISGICTRYRVPVAYKELAKLTASHVENALNSSTLSAEILLDLFNALDIYRREQRFHDFLETCKAIGDARNISFDKEWLHSAAHAAMSADIKPLLAKQLEGNVLGEEIKKLRLEKVKAYLKSFPSP